MADAVGLDPRRKGGGGNGYHQASNQDEFETIIASPEFPAGDGSDVKPPQTGGFTPLPLATAKTTKASKAKKKE